ncbi:MMPL family transporter [Algivirga pacifica]|uniref:MMPL family transporter n=2 Tax=Algivirga pacifica TaxID=1162670 RepID=A0ABP9D808_9BACT
MYYEFMRIIPEDDPDMEYYTKFRELFGEDANAFVLGIKDDRLYELEQFNKFKALGEEIEQLEGISNILSIAKVQTIDTDRENQRFNFRPLFTENPKSQQELDSLLAVVKNWAFYKESLFGKDNATFMAINIQDDVLNSKDRTPLMNKIIDIAEVYQEETGIELHYAGLPYVRSIMAQKVKAELLLFLGLSVAVTALVLFLFFRSFSAVFVPLVMIGIIIVWIVGTLGLLGYKITILTGLLPPVLVVIGIPNSVYLLNKYHSEYLKHGNKIKALATVIKKIGMITLITNTTTAIGFCVLVLTGITAMQEFGVVAGINIFVTFVISIMFIPAVFSYLPDPDTRHLKHLEFAPTQRIIQLLEITVTNYRGYVYIASAVLIVVALIGTYKVKAVSYMVDDLPEDYHVQQHLKFFEEHFEGVMPLEVVVDTGRERGMRRPGTFEKVEEIQNFLSGFPEVSPALSVVTGLKAANQAFYEGDSSFYRLPSRNEITFLSPYIQSQSDNGSSLMTKYSDSTQRYLRISMKMADIGSIKMDSLLENHFRPKIDEILEGSRLEAFVTGTTLIFIKGNEFLIKNLKQSMMIAFLLIAIIMGTLFGNLRIVLISLVPNIIPLIVTAGLMGYVGIPLKPSTAIVFSIAFGISVDDSIHFLAKYRQEMKLHHLNLKHALIVSIRETGTSMLYTSIILFFGFIIFVFSAFGGTIALGLLTSITLLVAMITNLVLLPSLLYTFDIKPLDLEPMIDGADDFYFEDEDEEINLNEIKKNDDKED